MGLFHFANLVTLHADMRRRNVTRTVFPFEYKGKGISCMFITDTQPRVLYLTTLGENAFTVELSINANYETATYIERYFDLREYLGIPYNPDAEERFKPVSLFRMLCTQIPTTHNNIPDYHHVLKVTGKLRVIEDADRIYFADGKEIRTTTAFLIKTLRKLALCLGKSVRLRLETQMNANVSSRWTSTKDEETLTEFNRFL